MDSAQDIERRLEQLETTASFTEDLLEQLNLTVYRQQAQIDRLLRELLELQQRMPTGDAGTARNLRDELPPHY